MSSSRLSASPEIGIDDTEDLGSECNMPERVSAVDWEEMYIPFIELQSTSVSSGSIVVVQDWAVIP